MTIARPSADAEIDWTTLRNLTEHALDLRNEGKLDAKAFDELWAKALEAAGGQKGPLQSLEMLRPTRSPGA